MNLSEDLINKYKTLEKSLKSEITKEYLKEFGFKTRGQFEQVMKRETMPTPLQNEWLSGKIEQYYNYQNGFHPVE